MFVGTFYPEPFSPTRSEDELKEAVTEYTGLSCRDLATKFESIGDDCEFGLVQRRCGAEPLGLFRFSNPSHDVILRAVKDNFKEFGEGIIVELDQQQPRREWIVVDQINGLRQHTFIYEGDNEEVGLREKIMNQFRFLRRIHWENICNGAKRFVIKSGENRLCQEILLTMRNSFREKGPCWLLWVEPGPEVGRIEIITDGLLRGTIDQLTVQPDAHKFSFAGWLAVLSSAWRTLAPLLPCDSPMKQGAPNVSPVNLAR